MEHPRIDDEQIIDRYLVGGLSPEEEALFEEHLFECAACLEKVQWGEELRRGLRTVAAEDAARAAVSRGVVALGLLAWLRSRRPRQLAGLATVALALVLLPAVVAWQQVELGRARAAARQAAVTTDGGDLAAPIGDFFVVSLGVVRDAGGEVEIRPDPDKEAVLLSLELQSVDAARYRVTLYDAAGEVLWRGEDLEPNLYDTLLIALPSSFLAPGSYRIIVEGSPAAPGEVAGEMAGEMTFRVLPER